MRGGEDINGEILWGYISYRREAHIVVHIGDTTHDQKWDCNSVIAEFLQSWTSLTKMEKPADECNLEDIKEMGPFSWKFVKTRTIVPKQDIRGSISTYFLCIRNKYPQTTNTEAIKLTAPPQ